MTYTKKSLYVKWLNYLFIFYLFDFTMWTQIQQQNNADIKGRVYLFILKLQHAFS